MPQFARINRIELQEWLKKHHSRTIHPTGTAPTRCPIVISFLTGHRYVQIVLFNVRQVIHLHVVSYLIRAAFSISKRAGVLELIVKGKVKTTLQAEKWLGRTYSSSFEKFSVGDWVEINSRANPHHGERGQVDLLLKAEQQISVILENIAHSVRFDPQELTLSAKASAPCPYQAGDLVRIDIDRAVSIEAATQKFKGLWGRVQEIGELGSVKVDVGCTTLQLFAFDLKPLDNPSPELKDVALRVLRLRKLELDEIEQKMLDVLQAREWFTAHQLIHLETIENLYLALHPMG